MIFCFLANMKKIVSFSGKKNIGKMNANMKANPGANIWAERSDDNMIEVAYLRFQTQHSSRRGINIAYQPCQTCCLLYILHVPNALWNRPACYPLFFVPIYTDMNRKQCNTEARKWQYLHCESKYQDMWRLFSVGYRLKDIPSRPYTSSIALCRSTEIHF